MIKKSNVEILGISMDVYYKVTSTYNCEASPDTDWTKLYNFTVTFEAYRTEDHKYRIDEECWSVTFQVKLDKLNHEGAYNLLKSLPDFESAVDVWEND